MQNFNICTFAQIKDKQRLKSDSLGLKNAEGANFLPQDHDFQCQETQRRKHNHSCRTTTEGTDRQVRTIMRGLIHWRPQPHAQFHCVSKWLWAASTNVPVYKQVGFPGGSAVKNLPTNAGDAGSVPGLGRSPGEGNGNPLQYSCLENPTDRGA